MSVRATRFSAHSLPAPRRLPSIEQLLEGLHARLAGPRLDARLAAGERPLADHLLAARGRQLGSRRQRLGLATAIERLQPGRGGLSAAIPVDGGALELARPALGQLAQALRARDSVQPRGVALTRRLLTEPASPLYRPPHPEAVYEAAREALLALMPERGSGAVTSARYDDSSSIAANPR